MEAHWGPCLNLIETAGHENEIFVVFQWFTNTMFQQKTKKKKKKEEEEKKKKKKK